MTTRAQLHMADKQDTKEKIIAVGPGADEDAQPEPRSQDSGAGDDYQYPEGDDEDSPGRREASDERVGHAENDPDDDNAGGLTREQKRRRRKREKYDRDQRELALLRVRNEQLERQRSQELATIERRQTQSDVMAIDGRISQAQSDVREAEDLLRQAIETKDSNATVEALRVRDELRDGLRQLQGTKQQTVRAGEARQAAASQPPPQDPAIAMRAQEWAREHPWFDARGGNEESAIAYAVERRVSAEGRLDPRQDEYWEEVDRRLARRLPERYRSAGRSDDDDDDDEPQATRESGRRVSGNGTRKPSGPTIKVGGRERTLRKGEVYIDEDRKAAMIEAGVWDDPKERERFMKAYQTYDRDAGRRPR